jgi:hypothetical protein
MAVVLLLGNGSTCHNTKDLRQEKRSSSRGSKPESLEYESRPTRSVLFIVQLLPPSCHFPLLVTKYSPQRPALRHPESVFFPYCERPMNGC